MNERVSLGRRLAAITIDWLACYAVISAVSGGIGQMGPERSPSILALFYGEVLVLTILQGASLGQKLFGIKVVRFSDGGELRPLQVLVRTSLLVLVVTAVTYDENGRGIHERASGSILNRV
ncbi:MAG: RDD family protein [Actinobacteria bacterium]|uniref:Unannotated protein n=1 Tax=freshwater metagenome TaxID=449393 RepID=A0A6J6WA35_9ZZZZ|nr:RDD family protein [Actinomycetota bacterium]MSY36029.1 RDD family protein [Actinomycetota bacterium]MTA72722.1 RDD family protein [Actinomycetota bacterium]MTB29885.1 RDD family protein [Actinomycetota bacterium]